MPNSAEPSLSCGSSNASSRNTDDGPATRTRAKSRLKGKASESPTDPDGADREQLDTTAESMLGTRSPRSRKRPPPSPSTPTEPSRIGKEKQTPKIGGDVDAASGQKHSREKAHEKPKGGSYQTSDAPSTDPPTSSTAAGVAAAVIAVALALLLARNHDHMVALVGPGRPWDLTFMVTRSGDGKGCNARMSTHVLKDFVLPKGAAWAEWTDHLDYVAADWAGGGHARKALTLLLAGDSEDVCARAAATLPPSFPACLEEGCLLHLEGIDFSAKAAHDSPGKLQGALVAFLQRCPKGVVMVNGLHHISRRALPVLFSALSEHGQFTHMGQSVHASGAIFVFTMEMDLGQSLQEDPEALERHVKREVVESLLDDPGPGRPCWALGQQQDTGSGGSNDNLAAECQQRRKALNAFRRRFDLIGAIASG